MAGHISAKGIAATVLLVVTAVGVGSHAIHAANLAQGRPYTISPSAEPNYPDTRHAELTDGRKGSASYLSPAWSGYHVSKGQAVDIVIDLGRVETVYGVTIGMLHHPAVGIMPPIYIAAGLSEDGKHWAVWDVIYPPAPAPSERATPRRVTYTLPGSAPRPVTARYVRVHLPLEISLFIDEIEVDGIFSGQSDANTSTSSSASTTEPPPVPGSPAHAGLPPWPKGDQFDLAPIGPYRTPGETTGSVHDIVLLPLYPPVRWDMQQLLPYITFGKPADEEDPAVNQEPLWEPQDWLFDTVLFAPVAAAPSGRFFHTFSNPGSVFADWLWLVDTCFAPDGPLASLEQSTAWAGDRLGDAGHKVKVILALPSPNPKQTEFWSGIDEDPGARQYFESNGLVITRDGSRNRFSGTLQERRIVLEWMIDEILARWQQAGFRRLELAGFYWFEEGVSEKADDQALVKQVAQIVHERGSRFYWIPHFRASGYATGESGDLMLPCCNPTTISCRARKYPRRAARPRVDSPACGRPRCWPDGMRWGLKSSWMPMWSKTPNGVSACTSTSRPAIGTDICGRQCSLITRTSMTLPRWRECQAARVEGCTRIFTASSRAGSKAGSKPDEWSTRRESR
ncbi:MAG TPA: DUF4855 domain-containing protein [Firmicutes bacterium]|nr:DUF4855 domain-containing protein [Bacillota bacterium]